MQQVLATQQNSLAKLLELSKQDRLLQLTQAKEITSISKDGDNNLEQLKKIDASINALNVKLNDKGKDGVSSNVIKLFTEIKKTTEQVKQLSQASTGIQGKSGATSVALSKAQAKDITGKAMERRQYRSIGDRVGEFKDKAKDFFTMRGFLDKTGIVKRGTGGVFSDALDRREEKQKYVASRLKMDPTARLHGEEKSKQIFSRQFDEQQNIQRNIRKNESTLSTYNKQGFTEEQIKRSEEFKKRDTLATDLAKVDTRVRPQGFDPKTGLVKQPVISAIKPETITEKAKPKTAKKQAAENNVVPIISAIKPEVISEKAKPLTAKKQAAEAGAGVPKDTETAKPKSAKKQKATATAAVSSVISAIKPETITEKPQTPEDQKRSAVILPFTQPKKVDKGAEAAVSALSGEEASLEQNKKIDEQSAVLKKIEENTRGAAGAIKPAPKEEAGAGGGILDSIMGLLGTGLMSAVKFLFSPKNLLKAFTKFFAPAMIIGSLVNGIMDGFKVFSETGSIGEALIAGLGGVLSFLTFGLFDAETIKNVVSAVTGFVNDYIVEPITNFISFIGEAFDTYIKKPVLAAFETVSGLFDEYIVQPLKTVFEPVTKFFSNLKDTVFGWFENFEIPGINFSVLGKEFGFGPWRPFKSETAAAAVPPAAPAASKIAPASAPQSGNMVAKGSEQNKEANMEASKPSSGGGNTIVSAPTVNNVQNTQQTIKLQPRNRDNSVTNYLSSRYV